MKRVLYACTVPLFTLFQFPCTTPLSANNYYVQSKLNYCGECTKDVPALNCFNKHTHTQICPKWLPLLNEPLFIVGRIDEDTK